MNPILELKNINSEISRVGTPILNSLSLTLNSKDRLVLKGPSGSGKSLLLRSIVFFDPIKSGEVWFHNQKLKQEDIPSFRSQVVYLSQKPCFIEGSVEDNLISALQLKTHQNKKYDRAHILKLLHQFNLNESFLGQPAKHLSGGEGQIVALIRALSLSPQVLLLDEPTASLDKNRSHSFETLIKNWIDQDPSRAFIWVTHQTEQETTVGNRTLEFQ